jgi:sporulation protein YlmC with PRC-barrel domain
VKRSSTIVGSAVRNLKGDDIGKIHELTIDAATGRIAYAVLAYGGFLGMGDKLFTIPREALMKRTVERQFVLDLDGRPSRRPRASTTTTPDHGRHELALERRHPQRVHPLLDRHG